SSFHESIDASSPLLLGGGDVDPVKFFDHGKGIHSGGTSIRTCICHKQILRFTSFIVGGGLLLCGLIAQDNGRHSFGHTGGFTCPFVPFLPVACMLGRDVAPSISMAADWSSYLLVLWSDSQLSHGCRLRS
ncbi:unnamed protein product, partial [Linum tenue]